MSFAIVSSSVGQNAVVRERQLDELPGQSRLGDAVWLEAARLARHARNVEGCARLRERVVRLAQAAGTETDERVQHLLAEQLHAVGREEERDLVPRVARRACDEEPERCARGVLRPSRDVNQDLRHAGIVGGGPCRYLGKTLAGTRIHLCGRLTADIAGSRIEADLPGRQGKLLFAYLVVNRLRP